MTRMSASASGVGCYRRRIRLASLTPASSGSPGFAVRAELEDDFHHFVVVVGHDGARVTSVGTESIRYPWSTCPMAEQELAGIVGMALSDRVTAVGQVVRGSSNCTHMFDLAGLAVAQAGSGRSAREYEMEVSDRIEAKGHALLLRDGRRVLSWVLDGSWIVDPPPFAGQKLRGGFVPWAEQTLPPDEAEAAIVLRRGCEIAFGRRHPLDHLDNASRLLGGLSGVCFTFQPERAGGAQRMKGTAIDFTDHPEDLLAGPALLLEFLPHPSTAQER
jgi:hypothetical protein